MCLHNDYVCGVCVCVFELELNSYTLQHRQQYYFAPVIIVIFKQLSSYRFDSILFLVFNVMLQKISYRKHITFDITVGIVMYSLKGMLVFPSKTGNINLISYDKSLYKYVVQDKQ